VALEKNYEDGSCERSRSVEKKRMRKKCWKSKERSEVGKNEGTG
jgi:hypothetical protein